MAFGCRNMTSSSSETSDSVEDVEPIKRLETVREVREVRAERIPIRKKLQAKGRGRARPRADDPVQEDRYRQSVKKLKIKQVRARALIRSFVFVGNLSTAVTEDLLRSTFKCCGTIYRVAIRYTSGTGVVGGNDPADRLNASLEFQETGAANNAMALNGSDLLGHPMRVCLQALNLPDVRQRLKQITDRKKPVANPPADPFLPFKHALATLKRLTVERTQLINPDAPLTKNNVYREISFPKTVM